MEAQSRHKYGTLLVKKGTGLYAARKNNYKTSDRLSISHYRKALGAILVYDVTNESTFTNLKIWLENLRQNGEADLIIMLVGNKTDLL